MCYMGGCQNYGPFLGTLNIRGRITIGTSKRTIILTTTHMGVSQNQGYYFGGSYNKDSSILGSILGSPHFGKLPYRDYTGSIFPYSLLTTSKILCPLLTAQSLRFLRDV